LLLRVCITERSGQIEAEIKQQYDNLRRRLETDYETVHQELLSLRATEAKRLQTHISNLETSRMELEGLRERLLQLVTSGSDVDVILDKSSRNHKPTRFDESGSDFDSAIAFRQNSLLIQDQSNLIGQVVSNYVATDAGK